jgi:hypothetical protein
MVSEAGAGSYWAGLGMENAKAVVRCATHSHPTHSDTTANKPIGY